MDYEKAEKKITELVLSTDKKLVLQIIVDFLYNNFKKYNWVGIYIVEKDNLLLGPWQGEHATEHVKIPVGKGICGSAAATGKTEIIPDVNKDKRYLSCFVSTKSEIVVPIKRKGRIIGEIDIDSDISDAFTYYDKIFLEKIANILKDYI